MATKIPLVNNSGQIEQLQSADTISPSNVAGLNLSVGTSLQVTAGSGTAALLVAATINTIQGIRTADTPQFARLGLGAAANGTYLLNLNGALVHGTSSGVGITTTSPNQTLEVSFNLGLVDGIRLSYSGDTRYYHNIYATWDGGSAANNNIVFNLCTKSINTTIEVMRLVGNGNVSIGGGADAVSAASTTGNLLNVGKNHNAPAAINIINPNTGASAVCELLLSAQVANYQILAYSSSVSAVLPDGVVVQCPSGTKELRHSFDDATSFFSVYIAGTEVARLDSKFRFDGSGFGAITRYKDIATVSNGVPSIIAQINSTGLTANVGASTLYAVPSSGAGMYSVSVYLSTTTAASVSSTMPNAQVVYTDLDSNTSVTLDVSPILGAAGLGQSGLLTANTVGTVFSGVVVIYVKASTTIQYKTVNYASTAAGMTYSLRIRLEAL